MYTEIVNLISPSYDIGIGQNRIRQDRMDESFTMKLTGSGLGLVSIYGEIKCLIQIK